MNFEQFALDPSIMAGVRSAGYIIPTPIQIKAIPEVLKGIDVLALAQTGTGKTAAFMLPILHRLNGAPSHRPKVLVLAPTRELAEQIHKATLELGKHTRLRSVAVYGGVSKNQQISALKRGTEVIIACPGRLLDHMGAGDVNLSGIETLVIDEADRMCDMGFMPDIKRILKSLPEKKQILFFSATMPEDIARLAHSILKNPVTVRAEADAPAKTVSHALFPVPDSLKKKLLFSLISETASGRMLIFTRTKHRARSLAADLGKAGHKVAEMQGNLSQNRRQAALAGFKRGKFDIMVATDIAARGIDVSEITHVINYDMPDTIDAYTHRIGRTGRALQTGEAFTILTEADEGLVKKIERILGKPIERRRVTDFDYGNFDPEKAPVVAGGPTGPSFAARRRSGPPSRSMMFRPGRR